MAWALGGCVMTRIGGVMSARCIYGVEPRLHFLVFILYARGTNSFPKLTYVRVTRHFPCLGASFSLLLCKCPGTQSHTH